MDYFHLKYYHDHIDPEVKRKKRLEDESFRVSQWFERYFQKYSDELKNNFNKEFTNIKVMRNHGRTNSMEYVNAQVELFILLLNHFKETGDSSSFFDLKNLLLRTLTIDHQELRSKIYNINYNK